VRYKHCALFYQQFQKPLFLDDERINPPRLAVEKCGDGLLFDERGDRE